MVFTYIVLALACLALGFKASTLHDLAVGSFFLVLGMLLVRVEHVIDGTHFVGGDFIPILLASGRKVGCIEDEPK